MADTGRSLQMHADRVSFEEADIQIALKPVRLLQHRMTAESPVVPDFCVAAKVDFPSVLGNKTQLQISILLFQIS